VLQHYSSLWETYLRATERHLPYRITQVNVLRHNPGQTDRLVLDYATPERWKAELTRESQHIG